jgi:hypothetical protein
VFRGVELTPAALECYHAGLGKFIAWPAFTSFTTDNKVAEEFARPKSGGVGVIFELKTAGRPRIKSQSAHEHEEELILHPFSAIRVDAIEGWVVKLTEVVVAQLERLPPMQTNYLLTTVVPAAEIAKSKEELARKDGELKAKEAKIVEKDAELKAKDSELEAKDAELKARDGKMAEKDAEITRPNGEYVPLRAESANLMADTELDGVEPGTLLAMKRGQLRAVQVELTAAELLFRCSAGRWEKDDLKAKIAGKAPLLVLVESEELGICGGFVAVPFPQQAARSLTGMA